MMLHNKTHAITRTVWKALYSYLRSELGMYTLRTCTPTRQERAQAVYTALAHMFGTVYADNVFQEWRDRHSADIPTWVVTQIGDLVIDLPDLRYAFELQHFLPDNPGARDVWVFTIQYQLPYDERNANEHLLIEQGDSPLQPLVLGCARFREALQLLKSQ